MSDLAASNVSAYGCPGIDRLRAFALGQVAQDECERLLTHLGRCSHCGAMLLALPEAGAEVVDSLRQGTSPASGDDLATVAVGPPTGHSTGADRAGRLGGPRALCVGRYTIRQQLGHGGFGVVYEARDEELDRLVAVKLPHSDRPISPEQLYAYHSEARLHASLDHPHIVPIYDVGRTDVVPFYLVSKLIDGEDLAEQIRRARPGFREAAALLVPLAEALEHMHGRGLVHRDVKPRNVLLDSAGTPYLADFGLAVRPAGSDRAATPPQIVGTPAYMSPEQARGESPHVDGRTDIYSLGVVLYELLTGAQPFQGDLKTLRRKVLSEEPPTPRSLAPGVPRDLEAICLKAMAKDSARRYQRAAHLAEDLRQFLRGEPLRHARRVGPLRRAVVWGRRNPALLLVAALASALAFAAVRGAWVPPEGPPSLPPEPPRLAVALQTEPAGAQLSWFPLDGLTGMPRPQRVTRSRAGEEVLLAPGYYLVVAVLPGQAGEPVRFHEVFRQVPEDTDAPPRPFRHQRWKTVGGVVQLLPVSLPSPDITEGMCLFPGSDEFTMGSAEVLPGPGKLPLAARHQRRVPAFYLDRTEVTAGAYRRWLLGPKFKPRPGDADLRAAASLSWDHAVAYAEKAGKRLPDEAEYEYAATDRGRSRFPWGDSGKLFQGKKWTFGPVGEPGNDRLDLPGQPPVFGLYSNVAEWTSSWLGRAPGGERPELPSMVRVVRGAPFSVVTGDPNLGEQPRGPRERLGVAVPVRYPGLGFRCARSARPRLTAKDFVAILPP
jgi:formylglycine-generating enzyme required for sulfatase activity